MKKARRLLSVLLSVLMIASMLPMGALAATYPEDIVATDANDIFKCTVTASDTFGYDGYKNVMDQAMSCTSITEYNGLTWSVEKNIYANSTDTSLNASEKAQKALELYEKVYTGASKLEIESSETETKPVYIGLKSSVEKIKDAKGVMRYFVLLVYDSDYLEPAYDGPTAVALNPSLLDKAQTTGYGPDAADAFEVSASTTGEAMGLKAEGYSSSLRCTPVEITDVAGSHYFIPKNAAWDVVLPFNVKAGVSGTTEVSVATFDSTTDSAKFFAQLSLVEASPDKTLINITGSDMKNIDGDAANMGGFATQKVQLDIVKRSAPPVVEPEKFAASIRDVKNLPYKAAADDAAKTALNDTITIPTPTEGQSGFKTGDVLFLYADKEHTQELGFTVLNAETLVHKDGDTVTAASQEEKDALTDGADLAGMTFRLAPCEMDNTTNPGTTTVKVGDNGYSYLKGESVVYLARLAKEHINDNTYQPSDEEIKIEVTSADTPIYYHGDVNVRGTKAGYDAAHPLDVKFGTTVQDLLSQLGDDILGTVNAPVEDGNKEPAAEPAKTVETSLDTSKATLTSTYADILSTDEDTNEAYISKHGKIELVFPYKDASDTNHTYTQPTAHVDGTAPVYGAKIYLNVTPDPADYYFAAAGSGKTMTVSGKTWKHFESNSADSITVYQDNSGVKGEAIQTYQKAAFDSNHQLTVSSLPVANSYVWVTYNEGGSTSSDAVRVLVTDGTPQIASDIVFKKGGGDDGTVYIFENTATLTEILEDENVLPVDIPLNGSEYKGLAKKENAAAIAGAADIKYEKLNGETYEPSTDSDFTGRRKDDQFRISIPITPAVLTAIIPNTVGNLPAGYANNGNRKFQITVKTVTRVTMEAADGNGYQTAVVENNYLGKDDIFTIGNVAKNDLNAQVGDTVRVYKTYNDTTKVCSDQIGFGTVTKVDGEGENPRTFTCKVDQIGRNSGDTVYVRFMGDGDTRLNMTGAIPMTLDKHEDYAFFSLSSYADPLKVTPEAATPTVNDIYGAVSAPTIKYGYYVKDSEGVISEDATATYSQTLANTDTVTQYTWSDEGAADTTYFDGTHPSTLTLSNTAELKSKTADGTGVNDNVPIVIQADKTRTTVAHIQYVAQNVDPLSDEIAQAIHDNLTIANNPYPQGDAITVAKEAGAAASNVTVKFYRTQADADSAQNEVFSFKLGEISTNDIPTNITKTGNTAAQNRAILGTGAGTLYVTYEGDDTKVNETSRTVTYTAEPFIVRGSTIDPTTLSVNADILSPTEAEVAEGGETPAAEDELTRLIAKLPKQMTATADHLEGETPYTAISGESKNVPMTITGWEKEDGTPLTVADVQAAIAAARASTAETKAENLKLKAVYTEESLPASIAVDGANVPLLTAINDGSTDLVAKTEGFNKVAFTVTITANTAIAPSRELNLPENVTDSIKTLVGDPTNNDTKYTENDGKPENDAIEFAMTDASVTDAKGATVKISYTAPGPKAATATGVINTTTGELTITAPDDFEGFDTTNPSMQVQFTKDGYADSNYYTVAVPAVATALTITEVANPRTLSIPLGMTKDEVLGLINGVGNVNVKFDSTATPTGSMALVQESGAVTWTLKEGTATGDTETGHADGLADVSDDWTAELNDASKHLYLTAKVNTTDGFGEGANNVTVNDTNLLAIIPVTLYNDKTNPLQMEVGNSDLYHEGATETVEYTKGDGTKAQTTSMAYLALQRRANGNTKTYEETGSGDHEDYKYDTIFYYFADRYDDNGFATSNLVGDKSQKVEPYTQLATGVDSLKVSEETTLNDFSAWTNTTAEGVKNIQTWTSGDGWTAKIEQLNEDGTEIQIPKWVETTPGSGTYEKSATEKLNYIEPRNAPAAKNYAEPQKAGTVQRYIERYIIRYTMTNGKDIYVVERKVKLRYVPGDADLNGAFTAADVVALRQSSGGIGNPFELEEELKTTPANNPDRVRLFGILNNQALEYDGNGEGVASDSIRMRQANGGIVGPSGLRW